MVIKPGWLTTIQDLGRHGRQQYGVSVSGAMDRVAHVAANRLVGNRDQDATVEITLRGPELLIEQDTVLALAGADLTPMLDGMEMPLWTAVPVKAGSRLTFGAKRAGARCYLAVAGGIDAAMVLGSRATHVATGTGGLHGRALMPGDRLSSGLAPVRSTVGRSLPASLRPYYSSSMTLRIVSAPQAEAWGGQALAILARQAYRLTSQSNRMGYRLEGPPLPVGTGPWISDATAMGVLQIPPDGQPILLMADRQTTGGYPKPAAVITADLPLAGQLVPGDTITFRSVSLAEAHRILVRQWGAWDAALPPHP